MLSIKNVFVFGKDSEQKIFREKVKKQVINYLRI